MSSTRNLPDPDLNLRDASDFILGSPLARKALETNWPRFPLALRDLVEAIHQLVKSCHLPEFTDHGLPHLCSLVDRISRWTDRERLSLPSRLEVEQAAILLLATLVHDLGMLSQKAEDLPEDAPTSDNKAVWSDVPSWVRKTHVRRLPKLAKRIIRAAGHEAFVNDERFERAISVATAHDKWPWEWTGSWQEDSVNRALAAVIAVADLLDEDAARCDTLTLLRHRDGTQLNTAHWLRHCLTKDRILVDRARIVVRMVRPPNCGDKLRPVFGALRNHFRLVAIYCEDLTAINAQIENIELSPCTGMPHSEEKTLDDWRHFPGFGNENALCFQLLRSFMPEALKDNERLDPETIAHLRKAEMEDVDLSCLLEIRGSTEPRTADEQTFAALLAGGDEG